MTLILPHENGRSAELGCRRPANHFALVIGGVLPADEKAELAIAATAADNIQVSA